MTACNCKRWASFVVLCLAAASWAIALGGLGAITWAACTDTQATRTDVASTEGAAAGSLFAALGVPPANTDTAVCARSWRWEWWTLFFQAAIMAFALAATLLPKRLARARYAIGQLLTIASVLIMIALNTNITVLWAFWDRKRMLDEWEGAAQKLYYSIAALVAGWILTVIFNVIWIGATLDVEVKPAAPPAGDDARLS